MELEAHRGVTFFYSPDDRNKLERLSIDPSHYGLGAFMDILRYQYRKNPNAITIVSEGSITYLSPDNFTTQINRSENEIKGKIAEVLDELMLAERVIFESPH